MLSMSCIWVVDGQYTCGCYCGSTYLGAATTYTYSAAGCASACYSNYYGICSALSTYSCYGSSCTYYSSSTYTCNCDCPSYVGTAASLTCSGTACANACYSNYGSCLASNTYGCCGTSCAYYSSPSTTYETCNCVCSTGSGYTALSQGTVPVISSLCTTSYCKSICNTTYSTCATYTNNAYCSSTGNSGINIYQSSPLFLSLAFIIILIKA